MTEAKTVAEIVIKNLRIALVLAACIGLVPGLRAQATASSCPASSTMDELMKDLDDAVSGAPDKDRTCLSALLFPEARLVPMMKGPDGKLAPKPLTLDEWVERVKARGKTPFYERQVKYSVESYGQIAHIWSTYEIRPTPDGKAEVRGINSIQAVYDGLHWRILEVLWQAEGPDTPMPQKYLP
jgi:hypothetical protein